MENTSIAENRRLASDVVAAIFRESEAVRDAITDLTEAGFRDISIAFPPHGTHDEIGKAGGDGAHSMRWKVRRLLEHDIHRRGADQMSAGKSSAEIEREAWEKDVANQSSYREVPLRESLLSIGVAETRIELLERQIGEHGALLMVHAGDHVHEVEKILENDTGKIRTQTAKEETIGRL